MARHNRRRSSARSVEPTTPLLSQLPEDSSRAAQHDTNRRRGSQAENAIAKVVEEEESGRSAWVKNTISLLAICVVGLVGWTIAWQTGAWKPASQEGNGGVDMAPGAQVFGYISAVAYLGYVIASRIGMPRDHLADRDAQRAIAADLQELLRQILRRYASDCLRKMKREIDRLPRFITFVFHLLSLGQRDLWRRGKSISET